MNPLGIINKRVVHYGIVAVTSKLMPYALIPLYIKLFGKEDYGNIVLFETYLLFAILFLSFQQQTFTSIGYFQESKEAFITNVNKTIRFIVLVTLSSLICCSLGFLFFDAGLTFILLLTIISGALNAILLIYQVILINSQNSKGYMLSEILNFIFYILCFGLLFMLFEDWTIRIGALIISLIVSIFYVLRLLKSQIGYKLHFDLNVADLKSDFIGIFQYGLPLVVYQGAIYLLDRGDLFIIDHFLGKESLAAYSIMYQVSFLPFLVFKILQRDIQPRIFKMLKNNRPWDVIRRFLFKYQVFFMAVAFLLMLVVWYVKDNLFEVVFDLNAEMSLVIPLVIGGLFRISYGIMNSFLFYYKDNKNLMIGAIIAALLNVALNVVLVPIYGAVISAYITGVSYFVLLIFLWYRVKKLRNITV